MKVLVAIGGGFALYSLAGLQEAIAALFALPWYVALWLLGLAGALAVLLAAGVLIRHDVARSLREKRDREGLRMYEYRGALWLCNWTGDRFYVHPDPYCIECGDPVNKIEDRQTERSMMSIYGCSGCSRTFEDQYLHFSQGHASATLTARVHAGETLVVAKPRKPMSRPRA